MKKYIPILKSREGELSAIAKLADNVKDGISPLVELLPKEAEKVIKSLSDNFNFPSNQVMIDNYLSPDLTTTQSVFETLQVNGVNAVPVVHLNSSDEYLDFVANYCNTYYSKVCIRISNEFAQPASFNTRIDYILNRIAVTPNRSVIIFDLGYISSHQVSTYISSLIYNIANLNYLREWDDITIAGGSFPQDLSAFAADTVNNQARFEWDIWQAVRNELGLPILYSDYGIKCPVFNPDTKNYSATASIKYTSDSDFVIYRGVLPKNHKDGGGQYHSKARQLVLDSHYDGRAFCWGDNEIYEISTRDERPGNAGTWVKIGQNRHITKVFSML